MKKTIYSEEQKIFCALLRKARKARLYTQEELADDLRVSQQWVAKVESGERRLDVIEFSRVAWVLNIDIKRFFAELTKNLDIIRKDYEISYKYALKRKERRR